MEQRRMDEQATAEASAGIDLTLAEWAAAIARGDLALLSSLVTEDAEFWTQGAAPLIGRAAVESAFKPLLETYRFSQRFDEQERCLGPNWSLLRGVEFNTLEPRRGGPAWEVKQRAFSLLRRESDGRWRFARGITNQGPAEKGEGGA
jgi:uncharacterized protein (TIGR02246 family)